MTHWVRRAPFVIYGDDGARFRVIAWEKVVYSEGDLEDSEVELSTKQEFHTEDGLEVYDRGNGLFEIPQLGLRASRVN
jgi:hypothetical protein